MIAKNIKLILRSRTSALIVLLGPLFITLLVGTAFNTTSLYDLRIGAYSESYSELTNGLLKDLSEKDFKVTNYGSEEECIKGLKIGESHVCAIFPKDLKVGTQEDVQFYVDESRMNLVWIIIETISKRVSTKSSELSLELTNVILNTLTDATSKIEEKIGVVTSTLSQNEEAKTKISALQTNLNSLNINFVADDLQLIEIRKKLDNIIEENNLSSGLFENTRESIEYSISVSNSLEAKFTNTSTSIIDAATDLNLLGDDLSAQTSNIKSIESTLTSIKENVDAVEVKDADTIVNPIKTSVKTVTEEKTHLNYLFPTLVILVVMFISLLLSSTLVIREKKSPAYFRNFITPTSDIMFILGDYLTNLIILSIQLTVIFIVGAFFFKEALFAVLGNSLLLLLIIASVFIMAGMLIGYVFKSEETATLGAISIGSLLLFFSGTILPLEALPKALKDIANFNPFVIAEGVLKKLMLFSSELSVVIESLGTLALFFIILAILVYSSRKVSKKFT